MSWGSCLLTVILGALTFITTGRILDKIVSQACIYVHKLLGVFAYTSIGKKRKWQSAFILWIYDACPLNHDQYFDSSLKGSK